MANYVAHSRTNYFKVKDPEAFEAWCKEWNNSPKVTRGGENDELYKITFDGGLPSQRWEESDEDEDWIDAEFGEELAEHLEEEWVAVLMEVGHERQRYVVGFAIAVNSHGDHQTVNLDLIYDAAKELGEHITRAEY